MKRNSLILLLFLVGCASTDPATGKPYKEEHGVVLQVEPIGNNIKWVVRTEDGRLLQGVSTDVIVVGAHARVEHSSCGCGGWTMIEQKVD